MFFQDFDFESKGKDYTAYSFSLIEKAISELPPKCQIIFVLNKWKSMKYKEIATHLNISIKTVEAQLHIANTKIINSLKKSFSFTDKININ